MTVAPEELAFEQFAFQDDCCDACRRGNAIINRARDEVRRFQCDSPLGALTHEQKKLRLVIEIVPREAGSTLADTNISVEMPDDVMDIMPKLSGMREAAFDEAIRQLTQAAFQGWSILYTSENGAERLAQMVRDLTSEDEKNAERPSHLN